MSKFEDQLDNILNAQDVYSWERDHGFVLDHLEKSRDDLYSQYHALLERDKKLVDTLKYIVANDPRGIHWRLAHKAKETLKNIGEEY